jgi:hypothetical protein
VKIEMTFEEINETLAQAVMNKNCGPGRWHCRPVFHFNVDKKTDVVSITGVTIDIQPGNV